MGLNLAADARDRKAGMTLAELDEFVTRAKLVGCDPADVLSATVTMRGKVKRLSLAAPRR